MTEAELEAMALARGGKVTRMQADAPLADAIAKQCSGDLSLPPDISEKDFQAKVIAYAESRGHKVYHTYDSRRSEPGYPDLTIVRPNGLEAGVRWVELKDETGKLTKKQEEWRDALIAANLEWHLWRPSDWPMIQEILK